MSREPERPPCVRQGFHRDFSGLELVPVMLTTADITGMHDGRGECCLRATLCWLVNDPSQPCSMTSHTLQDQWEEGVYSPGQGLLTIYFITKHDLSRKDRPKSVEHSGTCLATRARSVWCVYCAYSGV